MAMVDVPAGQSLGGCRFTESQFLNYEIDEIV